MKIWLVASVFVAGIFAQVAQGAQAPLTPIQLGVVQAVVDLCIKAEPNNHGKFQNLYSQYTNGITNSNIALAKATSDYQSGYATVQTVFSQLGADSIGFCDAAK